MGVSAERSHYGHWHAGQEEEEGHAPRGTTTARPSQSTAGPSTQASALSPTVLQDPFPKVGSVFPSRLAFQTAASRASHAVGHQLKVIKSPIPPYFGFRYGCVRSAPLERADVCPATFWVKGAAEGEGDWVVKEACGEHNHEGEELGEWEVPLPPVRRRRRAPEVEESGLKSRVGVG